MINREKIFLTILIVAFSFILYSCGNDEEGKKASEQEQLVNVEVDTLQYQRFTDYISIIGTVKPIKSAKLSSSEGGVIEVYHHDKGDYVKKGETILELENDVLKANLDAAKAKYDISQTSFEKQEAIYKDSVNSEFQYLESKSNRDQAKANYDLIKARYEKTFIDAPFDGVIDAKYVEEGEMAVPGNPIVNLINKNVVKIEAGVPEQYVGQVENGDSVRIEFENLLDKPIWGKITYVGTSISESNRTFPIEVTITNKYNLKPELVAELFIENGTYNNVVIIPEEVTTRTDQGFIVYVAEDGKARERIIDIIGRLENKVAVKGGLKAGDKLVVLGQQNLVDGENILVVN